MRPMSRLHAAVAGLLALVLAAAALAADPVPAKVDATIRAQLQGALDGATVTSVATSPIPGLYQVVIDGSETMYVTADGMYLISGDLYQTMPGKGLYNLTDRDRSALRRGALAKADKTQFITFPAKGKERALVYVFTDIDCGYCRKLHQEVQQLNAGGITVHYLAFPRAGVASETGRKMNAVWCAADRGKAMTDAKRGSAVAPAPVACKSPVADQYRLGVALGVRGTPAVFTAGGEQLGGYVPAKDLIAQLAANP